MKKIFIIISLISFAVPLISQGKYAVDHEMVAKVREEGFERSQIANTLSYMTDVLGARLTNSKDMRRAQKWVTGEMKRIGLTNIEIEPFMDYGVSWDNEFFSIHMLEPDYQTMVGYPIAHTPGINGRQKMNVTIADIKTKSDLEKYRGKLRGKAVLSVTMPVIDQERIRNGTPRFTDEELTVLANDPPKRKRRKRPPPDPERVSTIERNAFYKKEGVSVILETRGNRVAMVPGYARPGAKKDKWDRQGTLNHLPIVTLTPEHYNRMYRILERDIQVRISVEIKTKIGRLFSRD